MMESTVYRSLNEIEDSEKEIVVGPRIDGIAILVSAETEARRIDQLGWAVSRVSVEVCISAQKSRGISRGEMCIGWQVRSIPHELESAHFVHYAGLADILERV